MADDIDTLRAAGFSDAEIAADQQKQQLKSAGFSDGEIAAHDQRQQDAMPYRDKSGALMAPKNPNPNVGDNFMSWLKGQGRGIMDLPGQIADLPYLGVSSPALPFTDDNGNPVQGAPDPMTNPPPIHGRATAGLDSFYDKHGVFNAPKLDDADYAAGKNAGEVESGFINPFGVAGRVPRLANDFAAAKVVPRIAGDISDSGGMLSKIPAKLSNMWGGQDIMRKAAGDTQGEIATYGRDSLTGAPDAQTIGTSIADKVPAVRDGLTQKVDAAYAARDAMMPAGGVYDTSNVAQAYSQLAGQGVQNSILAKVIGDNPVLKRFSDLLGNGQAPQLSWSDLDALRKNIGPLTQSTDPEVRGFAKQLFAGISEDQRVAASSVPGGGTALKDANDAVKAKQAALDDLDTLDSRNPESFPGWLTAEASKGDTRLSAFKPYLDANQSDDLAKWYLNQKATDAKGNFNPDSLSTALQPGTASKPGIISSQARDTLYGGTPLAEDMERFKRLYDATQPSRDMAASAATATGPNPAVSSGLGAAVGHLAEVATGQGGSGLGAAIGAPVGYVAGKGSGLVAGGASLRATSPGGAAFLANPTWSPTSAGMRGGAVSLGQGGQAFPDVYQPPAEKHSEDMPEPADVRKFVASADPKMITQYVGSKLGPDIAGQIPTDPEGHAAAMNALLMNPAFSSKLLG